MNTKNIFLHIGILIFSILISIIFVKNIVGIKKDNYLTIIPLSILIYIALYFSMIKLFNKNAKENLENKNKTTEKKDEDEEDDDDEDDDDEDDDEDEEDEEEDKPAKPVSKEVQPDLNLDKEQKNNLNILKSIITDKIQEEEQEEVYEIPLDSAFDPSISDDEDPPGLILSPEEAQCDRKSKNYCILRDYKLKDGVCYPPDNTGNQYHYSGLDKYKDSEFANWLHALYYRNAGTDPAKNESSNVFDYYNRCKEQVGYGYLKSLKFKKPKNFVPKNKYEIKKATTEEEFSSGISQETVEGFSNFGSMFETFANKAPISKKLAGESKIPSLKKKKTKSSKSMSPELAAKIKGKISPLLPPTSNITTPTPITSQLAPQVAAPVTSQLAPQVAAPVTSKLAPPALAQVTSQLPLPVVAPVSAKMPSISPKIKPKKSRSRISGFKITQKLVKEETIPYIEPRNVIDEEMYMKEVSSNDVVFRFNNGIPQEETYMKPRKPSNIKKKPMERKEENIYKPDFRNIAQEEMFLLNKLRKLNKRVSQFEVMQEEMTKNLRSKLKQRCDTQPQPIAPAPSVPSPAPVKQTKVYSGVPQEEYIKPYRKPMKRPSPSDFVPEKVPSAAPEKIMKGSYYGSESPARFPRAPRERRHEQEGPDQRKMIKKDESGRSYGSKIRTSRNTIDIKVNYN